MHQDWKMKTIWASDLERHQSIILMLVITKGLHTCRVCVLQFSKHNLELLHNNQPNDNPANRWRTFRIFFSCTVMTTKKINFPSVYFTSHLYHFNFWFIIMRLKTIVLVVYFMSCSISLILPTNKKKTEHWKLVIMITNSIIMRNALKKPLLNVKCIIHTYTHTYIQAS